MKPNNTNAAKSKGSSRLSNVKYVFRHPLVYGGVFALMFTIISIIVTFLLFKSIPYVMVGLVGPLLAVEFSLIITGLYNAISTTTTLDYELDAVCLSGNCSKGWVIVRVKNTGRNVAEDTYALISIRARKGGALEEEYLGEFLVNKGLCRNLVIADEDPRIEDELLPWLLSPEGIVTKVSISPRHSGKLLVFEYERIPDGYVIRIPSEGGVGKPRVCLWLDFDVKYAFRIMVYGKNVRWPLETELYVTMDKLDAIASYRVMLRKIRIDREVFSVVLNELSNDGSIAERAAALRKIFIPPLINNVEIYLNFVGKFEILWNVLRNRFREEPKWAEYLGSIFGVLYEYAVYLALAKRWVELSSLIMNHSLLSSCNDDVCVMMNLLLNLITDKEFRERFGNWLISDNIYAFHNIYASLAYYVPSLRPALAHLFLTSGYKNITCESACGYGKEEYLGKECYEDCERTLSALNGNEDMVKEIALELDSVLQHHWAYKDWVEKSSGKLVPSLLIGEILDYVHNNRKPQDWGFFSRAVVELRLPTTSRLRFIFILHDLLRAREEFEKGNVDEAIKFVDLAETHAIIGRVKFKSKRDKELDRIIDKEPSFLLILPPSAGNLFNLLARTLTPAIKSNLKENKKFEISSNHALILLSLYHYHVQTNLAETWS
jgi:hypothetical protein